MTIGFQYHSLFIISLNVMTYYIMCGTSQVLPRSYYDTPFEVETGVKELN